MGRPDPGHHVLTLRINKVVTVELLRAGVGVAREGDAGAGVVAHVAEDHRLHVDRGAQGVRDLVEVAVVDGALVVPRGEHRLDRGA